MARRMLHYWLCPTDLGKTGSNKIVKNGPKFFCECPRRVNKYYKEVHDSLNFQDFQCPFIKKKIMYGVLLSWKLCWGKLPK